MMSCMNVRSRRPAQRMATRIAATEKIVSASRIRTPNVSPPSAAAESQIPWISTGVATSTTPGTIRRGWAGVPIR